MKFSYNWIQSYFKTKLPEPKALADILTMKSFEVEEVKKVSCQWPVVSCEDYILDIDILPNRAHDCLSHLGVAREIAALLNSKFSPFGGSPAGRQILNFKQISKSKIQNKKLLTVDIKDKSLVPRYAAYVIDGVKIAESPKWIKDRLASMGQKSINNIVDITNYIMWDTGQPLHAFDFDKIKGGSMTIRESKKDEKIETLDGEVHSLGDSDIIIEDGERIIDLAGIKGGGNTQIDQDTNTIIFQAAVFDPGHIRGTVRLLGLRTDAAVRYIHGFDPNISSIALNKALPLLLETSPNAKVVQAIDIYPNPKKPKKITLDVEYVNSLLGTYLSGGEIKQILDKLGFEVATREGFPFFTKASAFAKASADKSADKSSGRQVSGLKFQVTVPTYRLDVESQEDLIEEVGRMLGYENIKAQEPAGILSRPKRNHEIFWRSRARETLKGFGFSETYNYSLQAIPRGLDAEEDLIELENPVSDEFRYMRPALLFGALKNISWNLRYFDSVKIFEFGKVFFKEHGKISEVEDMMIALNERDGFYAAKGYVDEFLKSFGIGDFYYIPMKGDDPHGAFFHEGRRANIILNDKVLGFIGEALPDLASYYGIKERAVIAEFDFGKIIEEAEEEHLYQKPSKYPEIARDISILVPPGIKVVEVLNMINSVSGPLLRDVDLFDMFEGENLPDGMKNLAFHLYFQSDKRTLTSDEIDEIMNKIVKVLKNNLWEVR